MILNKSKIEVKDLISIGVYTALYFMMVTVSNLLVVFLIPGFSFAFIPVVSALLCGTIYMLMAAKVPKFGAITIMGSFVGVFQLINGHFPASIFIAMAFSLAADIIASIGNYRKDTNLLVSYIVFSFSTVGPAVPLLLFPNMYVNQLVEQGRDAAYIENAFASISENTLWILIISIAVGAALGGLFGHKMMHKHFRKAGIV